MLKRLNAISKSMVPKGKLKVVPEIKRALKKKQWTARYCVGLWEPLEDTDGELVRLFFVCDPKENGVFDLNTFSLQQDMLEVGEYFLNLLAGVNLDGDSTKRPGEVWTDSPALSDMLEQPLRKLGIRTVFMEEIPELRKLREDFLNDLELTPVSRNRS